MNIYTRSYDNARTGANLNETILKPANVNPTSFGKLFTVPTDGQIYAQPLYVSSLSIAGGTHNVVYVATMLNSIYALDADTGATLWTENFGTPINPKEVESDQNITWNGGIGILGTPVIDPTTNYMYFVAANETHPDGTATYTFNLWAIDIRSGEEVLGPVAIQGTYSTPDLITPLTFSAKRQNQRPALALANGNVYIAFSSHEDQLPYHGWVFAYNASTLTQVAVYADTTTGSQGGIWNAGGGPNIDAQGNLYFSTGNGSFGTTPNNLVQTGNSFIKLSPQLDLLDYFTPTNSTQLNAGDQDLGSSGMLLIPETNYLLGGGKQGVLYLVDSSNMGKFNSSTDQVKQEFQAVYGRGTSHIHGGPVYFDSAVNGPTTYLWGENDVLRAFTFNPTLSLLTTTPLAKSTMTAPVTNADGAMPGGFLSISANGSTNGITWASTPYNGDAVHQSVQGVLYAFDANNLNLLWSDKGNDVRDEVGTFAKYVPPIVANGKVYVATFGAVGNTAGTGALVVYGLIPAGDVPPAAPTGLQVTSSTTQINLTWAASTTPGVTYSVYRANASGNATAIHTVNTTTSFTDTTFQQGVTYTYYVTAVDGGGGSNPSNSVTCTTPAASTSGTSLLAIDAGSGTAAGNFVADANYTGGKAANANLTISLAGVTNPAPVAVYQTERYGAMVYNLAGLTAGIPYTVRLHFAETYWTKVGQRIFNVAINGEPVLTNFDIIGAAKAANQAVVESFVTTADSSGHIAISFTNGFADNAKVNGIEIQSANGQTGGNPPSSGTDVIAIHSGGGAVGNFAADQDFTGGKAASTTNIISLAGVTNPAPEAVYQSERWGAASYTLV